MQSLFFLVLRGCALVLIFLIGSLALISPVGATSAMSHQASAKATKFVDSYVDRMQHGGYSTAEITDALIALRSTYIKRQKSHLYSGSALSEIDAIIESLDTAIAGVSEGNCGTCDLYDPFNVYVPPRGNSVTTPTYPNSPYYLTNPSYPNYQYTPYTSQNTVTVTNTILSVDSSYSSQVRTDLSVTNAYRDYDMYTFSLQSNGYATNQPSSNRFITPNLVRQLSTQQWRNIGVYLGTEYNPDRVRNIRSLAESSTRNSLSTITLGSSFSDAYSSLSNDEFARQSLQNGSTKTYRTYRLYIARDNAMAFIVEYIESGTGYGYNNGYGNSYGYNNGYNSGYGSYQNTISGIDTNSFSDYGSYFTHSYRMSNGSKRYKMYTYIPPSGSSVSSTYTNLGISSRTSYNMGSSRTQYVNGQYTNTSINGYSVNANAISAIESSFLSYGYSSSVTLPGSNSQITFMPLIGNTLVYSRLSDNSYRMYRLLVAEDGSDAYLTEYVEN